MSLRWLPHWKHGKDSAAAEPAPEIEARTHASETQTPAKLALPISADVILESLREVEDPELGIGIVDLGLVYGVEVDGRKVRVTMTLTSPGCPIGPMLQAAVHGAVQRTYTEPVEVKVDLVWNPPWDPYKMASEEAKDMLGIW